MGEHTIAAVDDVGEGERITVQLGGREVTVFNVEEEFYAYTNWCPHQSGPACEGVLSGTHEAHLDDETRAVTIEWCREGEILNCPWHGWEYDVRTGECLSRGGVRLVSYPIRVDDGELVVSL